MITFDLDRASPDDGVCTIGCAPAARDGGGRCTTRVEGRDGVAALPKYRRRSFPGARTSGSNAVGESALRHAVISVNSSFRLQAEGLSHCIGFRVNAEQRTHASLHEHTKCRRKRRGYAAPVITVSTGGGAQLFIRMIVPKYPLRHVRTDENTRNTGRDTGHGQ